MLQLLREFNRFWRQKNDGEVQLATVALQYWAQFQTSSIAAERVIAIGRVLDSSHEGHARLLETFQEQLRLACARQKDGRTLSRIISVP